ACRAAAMAASLATAGADVTPAARLPTSIAYDRGAATIIASRLTPARSSRRRASHRIVTTEAATPA
ncbi:MAG TPA: hypothetical protein VNK51_22340, partial [Bradyrhizobium sp.]|nr:hypothetical protein [Bradyrhizobium sp.]